MEGELQGKNGSIKKFISFPLLLFYLGYEKKISLEITLVLDACDTFPPDTLNSPKKGMCNLDSSMKGVRAFLYTLSYDPGQ